MMHLTTECQSEIATALINRRRELEASVHYWQRAAAAPAGLPCDADTESLARQQLARVKEALVELDKRTIPWLHLHPDCCDLFNDTKISAPVGAAA